LTRRSITTWLAALALVVLFLPRAGSAIAATPQPVTLTGTVPGVVAHAKLIGIRPTTDVVTLNVSLSLRDRNGLLNFIHELNDPNSPFYHHPLSQTQANQLFNPTASDEQQVESWLQSNGLAVTQTYANHLMVDAQGTVGQIEAMLGVTIDKYQLSAGGKTLVFYAPDRDPTVDGSVSAIVQAITGLDTYPRFHKSISTDTNGTAHGTPAYLPQDFANAYDVNPLWSAGYTGSGQSIGITLWETPPADVVLQTFASRTGANVATVANGRLHVIPVDGGTDASISPDDGEAGLDIEYSSGMAPGATINFYEAPTDSMGNPTDQGLLDALNLAGTQGNRQITNSWGGCEADTASDAWTKSAENIFAANAATGHSYFFSSGDSGSWCDPYNTGTGIDPWPNYPASSPNVTSVGGTRFSRPIGTTWPGEVAWTYCASCGPEGSGGGYSRIFTRPSWQTGTGLIANGKRGYPDISADADPNTGAYVCYGSDTTLANDTCYSFTNTTCTTGAELVCSDWIGGTSLSSPLWAGMTAVLNQYLIAQGKPAAGFLAPDLYALKAKAQTYLPFHDITTGTNGVYRAGAYWDAVTGWGTPDLYNVARDIAGGGAGTGGTGGTGGGTPTNVIVNGDFESGPGAPWTESSTSGHELIGTSGPVHGGSDAAWLCGYNSCNDRLTQTFKVPSKVTSAVLTYWVSATTTETVPCYDRLITQIRTTAGGTVSTAPTLCSGNISWVQKSVNLTAVLRYHLNQTLQLSFDGLTNTLRASNFYIDDVSLAIS
jgi:kumamolisin